MSSNNTGLNAIRDRIIEALGDYIDSLPFDNINGCVLYIDNDDDSLRLNLDVRKIQGNTATFED